MTCNQNCNQGRNCQCDPPREWPDATDIGLMALMWVCGAIGIGGAAMAVLSFIAWI